MLDQTAGGLPPAAIDIVIEEIAGAFQDKLRVSMIPGGGSHIENPMTADLITTCTPSEQEYLNLQTKWVSKVKAHRST
jgi:hypothetical protein